MSGNFLGIDVGSITTKMVVINESNELLAGLYLRNNGRPLETIQQGLAILASRLGDDLTSKG